MKTEDLNEAREGGLAHLQAAFDKLDSDFYLLDGEITRLVSTLNLGTVALALDSTIENTPCRSLIEEATRRVSYLQGRSELQRRTISFIIEQIQ